VQRHRTLPIPQVIPDAQHQADDEIGVSGHPWSTTVVPRTLDTSTDNKPALRTPVYRRRQSERGIDYGLDYRGRGKRTLTIPLPVRSSLAQLITTYRTQISHYISRVRPFGMAPGYPTAHVLTLIQTSPAKRTLNPLPRPGGINTPGQANSGATANRGDSPYYMRGPSRFRKALPTAMHRYEPPTY
jgi:hypothetical protein